MRIAIIVGSQRPGSRSSGVAANLATKLARLDLQTYVLDLGETPLPMWDEGCWEEDRQEPWSADWAAASAQILACSAVIVISPEWGGMVPASLKNFFLLCEKNELEHKPGLIVGVSSGNGGAYPVSELRMSSYKNTHLCYLPDHLIIRNVRSVVIEGEPQTQHDADLQKRVDWTLALLARYAEAFEALRRDPLVMESPYAYGM